MVYVDDDDVFIGEKFRSNNNDEAPRGVGKKGRENFSLCLTLCSGCSMMMRRVHSKLEGRKRDYYDKGFLKICTQRKQIFLFT